MKHKFENKEIMQLFFLFGILFSILPLISASDWVEFGYDLNNSGWDKVTYPFGVNSSNYSDSGGFTISAIVNGSVYFMSYNTDKLYRANASDVSQIYDTFQAGGDIYYGLAISNGIVYLSSADGYVYLLNANNVSEMINSYNVGAGSYGIVVKGDYAYFPAETRMYKVNKTDILNIYDTYSSIVSNPTIKNGYVYIASVNTIYQLNASNLSLVHSFGIGNYIFGSVAVTENYVFIGKSGVIYQLNASDVSQEINRLEGFGDMNVKPIIANGYVYFSSITDLYQCNYTNISQIVDMFPASYNTIGYYSPSARGDKIYLATSDGHIYGLDATDISDVLSDIYVENAHFSGISVTDKYLYVTGTGAGAEDKMYMFQTGEQINETFSVSATLDYPTNITYLNNVTHLDYTINYADTCFYSTDNGITNHSISCNNNSIALISGYGSKTWTIYAGTDEGVWVSDSVIFYVTLPFIPEEPSQETGFTSSGQAIYDIMSSSGAGLGIFMGFMGQVLPPLLIILGLIGVIVLIGYLLSNVIKSNLIKFQIK